MRWWIFAAGLVGAVALVGAAGARGPAPLGGAPLQGPIHLRLLVASNPPYVLDVDRGSATRVRSVSVRKHDVLWVVGVGGRDAAVVAGYPAGRVFAVRGRNAEPTFLGVGRDAFAAADGTTTWVRSTDGCRLRRFGADGRPLETARGIPCHASVQPGGALGLVVARTRVVDPATGRIRLRTPYGVLAGAGRGLILAGPGRAFTLLDATTGRIRRYRWPSIVKYRDDTIVDPQGRYVALAFGDPAWLLGGRQAMDVWSLDTRTGSLTEVPGMPAFVDLKFTSMQWSPDGRLVILGEVEARPRIAIWRPGSRKLEVRAVRLPPRTSGSDSFAILSS
jgi:hypothetical protein